VGVKLTLPPLLTQLIANGRWPRDSNEAQMQNLRPRVPEERIKLLAPEESMLYLLAPPFHTVRALSESNGFWTSEDAAPSEIDFDLCLDIGDFGLGSDAPILLDYRHDRVQPRVLRLRWSRDVPRGPNHWVSMAPNFDAFAQALGL
jgi:hypothetical protein